MTSASPLSLLEALLPVYAEAIQRLAAGGAEWIQLDEPALVLDLTPDQLAAVERAYAVLAESEGFRQTAAADRLRPRRRGLSDARGPAGRRYRTRFRAGTAEPRFHHAAWLPGRQMAGGGSRRRAQRLDERPRRLARSARAHPGACPRRAVDDLRLLLAPARPLRRRAGRRSCRRRCDPGSLSPSRSWPRS